MDKKQFIDFMNSWMELNRASFQQISVLPPATKKRIIEAGTLQVQGFNIASIRDDVQKIVEIKNYYTNLCESEGYYYCFLKNNNNIINEYNVFVLDKDGVVLYSLDGKYTNNNGALPVDFKLAIS